MTDLGRTIARVAWPRPVKSFSVLWALAPRDLAKTLEDIHDQAVADTLDYIENNRAFTRIGAQGVAQLDTDGVIATAFTHPDSRAGDPICIPT